MTIRVVHIILILGICISSIRSQSEKPTAFDPLAFLQEKEINPLKAHIYNLDIAFIIDQISDAPDFKKSSNEMGVSISVYLPNGRPLKLNLHEAPVSHMDHYNKYPENKTYKITGGDLDYISGRLAISPRGVRGLIYTDAQTIFIESIDGSQHVSYVYSKSSQFTCDADMNQYRPRESSLVRSTTNIGDQITEYDIAIASSGEWSNERNDDIDVINDDINTYLSELNAIYEKELATSFILIADNDDIVFFDPETDGLDENNRIASAQATISGAIPDEDYDIGHVFFEIDYNGGGSVGSGIAGLGVTCNNNRKSEGWSGLGGNYSTAFFMDIFAHEVGHQLNAAHSFYGTSNFCSGFNRSAGAGYEPGAGNTMMSYEGTCQQNGSCTQSHNISPESSTVYLHASSVESMLNYLDAEGCGTSSSVSNSPPIVTVPSNKHIPIDTPFELSGSATDADGDPLVYNWDEYDTDNLVLNCPDGEPDDAATSTTAPLFRSLDPTSDGNVRTFPKLSDIANNEHTIGEILPSISRSIKMRLTARDFNANAGGVSCAEMALTVDEDAGPFVVSVANDPNIAYQSGENVTVTWDVNNTDVSPINCSNVEILFSSDGGMTYPITLAASTDNDGSHLVAMPANGTSQGRIKVKAINNYFFDINDEDITIISDCIIDAGDILDTEIIIADAGDPSLDLMLQSGIEIMEMSGTLDANDSNTNLNCENQNTNQCVSFTNNPKYETLEFTVDITGDYTFTRSSSYFSIINIYEESYDNGSVCTNWLASSGLYDPGAGTVNIGSSVTENLTAGSTYIVKFSGFYTSSTGSYTVSFSNNVSGKLYDIEATSPPGYTNEYIVVDDNNIIVGIDGGPDMTDDNIYSGGDYTIYGLSHISSVDLTSYIGGTFTTLQNDLISGDVCGDLSSNTKLVTVNGCTAGTKTVTNTNNTGTGSLRAIITDSCPGDNIVFSNSIPTNSTITLTTEILIDRLLSIDASAVNNLTLSGASNSRIFQIYNGVSLTINDMNLTNGFAASNGGAFYNQGEVIMSDITFEDNFDGGIIKPYTGDGNVILQSGSVTIKD